MGYGNGYDAGYQDCEHENRAKWTQEGIRQGRAALTGLLSGLEFKGDEASLGETRSAVSTIWRRLGGTISCLWLVLTCQGATPGYARVSDLVDHEVVTNVTQAIASIDVVAATNSIPWSGGPVAVLVESNATLSCNGAWPLARPCFVMVRPSGGTYNTAANLRLVGYQDWPTVPWQGIIWSINDVFYVNIIAGIEQ